MKTFEDGLSSPLAFSVATSGSSSESPIESKYAGCLVSG